MHELTFQNHFNFGRNPEDESEFLVSFGPLQRPCRTPMMESVSAAQSIYNQNPNKKLNLLLSGGIDSECMAQAFIAAKVPFQATFMRFKNNMNAFDIQTNIDFCQRNNIKYSFVDLDIIEFLESGEYLKVSNKYECQSPQLAAHLWLLDQVEGIPILGGNPMAPIWKKDHWFFIGAPGELHSTYFKYFLENNRLGVPFFFLYTPELIASFFSLPIMKSCLQKEVNSESDYTYEHKCQSYIQGGFNVQPRHDKFTGFELVRKHYDEREGTQHGIAFNRLFREPLEKLFPFPESYKQLVPQNYFSGSPE
ncbi:MAG: hypothetical protein H7256_06170 [Bdellovibrio sp.]|nr:hypothetical protein [Bdellovibrio sp.]